MRKVEMTVYTFDELSEDQKRHIMLTCDEKPCCEFILDDCGVAYMFYENLGKKTHALVPWDELPHHSFSVLRTEN